MKLRTLGFLLFFCVGANAQQTGVDDFKPKNSVATFTGESAPVVLLDEAHHNFHTMDGRYQPFTRILQSDGFDVRKNQQPFSAASLKHADVLVISNALHKSNAQSWDLPNPSAFTRAEIEALFHWVRGGGSLFLIADHMPFPAAASELGAIFGFHFNNGYVEQFENKAQIFSLDNAQLRPHPILKGKSGSAAVTSVRAFTGQAFLAPPQAKPLLTFGQATVTYMPTQSWKFPENTPEMSVQGWHQGASLEFGQGRLVVFGEAAMFSAQVSGDGTKMGVLADGAEQNEQFLLNIMHWLAGKI